MLDGRAAIAVDQDPGALLHLHPHPRLQQHHPHRHLLQKSKGCHNILVSLEPTPKSKLVGWSVTLSE